MIQVMPKTNGKKCLKIKMEISKEESAKEELERRKSVTGMLVREGPVLVETLLVAKTKACFGAVQQTKQIHLQSAFRLR